MKKFLIIVLALVIASLIAVYTVNTYRNNLLKAQKLNKEYESYRDIQVLGSELISIINRTTDINTKNEIEKDTEGYYIDNGNNSLHVDIQFSYKDKVKLLHMEDIEKNGSEAFIRVYSTASFKCTNIEYHEKTNNVKKLIFEEIANS